MRKFRIFTGGLGHESLTFTDQRTALAELQTVEKCTTPKEIEDYLISENIELIAGFMSGGTPGGIVTNSAYQTLKSSLLDSIKNSLPVDGVVLRLHGSMTVEGESDTGLFHGELDAVKAVRELLGDDVLISARLDLHGNIPEELAENLNIVSALRTAPHRDYLESLLRLCKQTVFALKNNLKPFTIFRSLPLLLPGENVVTDSDPAKSLYQLLESADQNENVLCSSIMVGFAWADVPWAGASILVSGYQNIAAVEKVADWLADEFWSKRSEFVLDGETCKLENLNALINSNKKTKLFLSDSGDNITAGASGTSLTLFSYLLTNIKEKKILYSQFISKQIIEDCFQKNIGESFEVALDDRTNGIYHQFSSEVLSRSEESFGRFALIRYNNFDILVGESRYPLLFPAHIEMLGIKQTDYDICTFKLGYLMPELKDIINSADNDTNIKGVMVLTEGPTQLEIDKLPYKSLGRSVYPLEDL